MGLFVNLPLSERRWGGRKSRRQKPTNQPLNHQVTGNTEVQISFFWTPKWLFGGPVSPSTRRLLQCLVDAPGQEALSTGLGGLECPKSITLLQHCFVQIWYYKQFPFQLNNRMRYNSEGAWTETDQNFSRIIPQEKKFFSFIQIKWQEKWLTFDE